MLQALRWESWAVLSIVQYFFYIADIVGAKEIWKSSFLLPGNLNRNIMKNLILIILATTVAIALLVMGSAYAQSKNNDKITINIGLYNSSKPSAMVSKFRPLITLLEEKVSRRLGSAVRIRMQIAKNYDRGIEYLADGKVDFARFGPASYVEAKTENPGIQILAIESKNRTKVVNGIIATGLHSPIRKMSDIKGKSFAFGDMQSASGRFVAQQFLLRNGITAKDLSRYEYLGRHDIVGVKIGVGDFAAGAMSEATFRRLLTEGEKIRELARFPLVSNPWVARDGIDPEIYRALKTSLLEISSSDDADELLLLDFNGFVEGGNNDYRSVADSMNQNHIFFNDEYRKSIEWVLATSKSKNESSTGNNIPATR